MATDPSLAQALGPQLVGRSVYLADSVRLGRIKEWRGDVFKVDIELEPDIWLAAAAIRAVAADRVELSCRQEQLDTFKRDID